jgi:hypothetical protein
MRIAVSAAAGALAISGGASGRSFVNWESPHVHPLDLVPGGAFPLAVNTADNRLEVFAVSAAT